MIYKRTDPTDLIGFALTPPLSVGEAARAAEVIDRLVEGDLNDLGLQVLWVRDHGEVADVVMNTQTPDSGHRSVTLAIDSGRSKPAGRSLMSTTLSPSGR